jgi:prepilin-type N-terminal cleavage/methylation domain-containing protein
MLRQKLSGFTIVELIVVIVVIVILATITAASYNGIQTKARDAARADSIAKIKEALDLYLVKNGRYPSATPNPGANGGWEASIDVSGTFMEHVAQYGPPGGMPVDPVNDTTYRFLYYRYPAGNGGCDASKGGFYVLIARFESASYKPAGNSAVGECSSPQGQWSDGASGSTHYAFHAYEKR